MISDVQTPDPDSEKIKATCVRGTEGTFYGKGVIFVKVYIYLSLFMTIIVTICTFLLELGVRRLP